jgi:hypothetical protein|tara:strand:+ start:213 stop:377 length:165 start_codon:yes stop_codon:yes gene_type:complete
VVRNILGVLAGFFVLHPMWFSALQLVEYPVALVAAWMLLAKKRPSAEAEGRPAL